jgi:hypothetical protein
MSSTSAALRTSESIGREATSSRTEEELSPATMALLCDDGDNLFLHNTLASTTAQHEEMPLTYDSKHALTLMKSRKQTALFSATHVKREKSVITELSSCIQKIAVSVAQPFSTSFFFNITFFQIWPVNAKRTINCGLSTRRPAKGDEELHGNTSDETKCQFSFARNSLIPETLECN